MKAYRAKNKEKIKAQRKEYVARNREKVRETNRAWIEANREHVNAYKRSEHNRKTSNARSRERYKEEPLYRCKTLARNLVSRCLVDKFDSSLKILGVPDWEYLNEYLTRTFEQNYNESRNDISKYELHIDHIIPVASASTEEEIIRLSHHSNLQYLKAVDNMNKSDKWIT